MKKKQFFIKGFELSKSKKEIKDLLKAKNLDQIECFEAERDLGTGYFFCKFVNEMGEVGECGKHCEGYIPNNGKNGRCRHYGYLYTESDKPTTIKR